MLKNLISSFFTKFLVAFSSLGILLISSRYLGGAIVGQISLVILNIAIIQTVNEIYTGSALVYFIPKMPFKKLYQIGFIWTLICILILNGIFIVFKIGASELWLHVLFLSFMITLQAFHAVILLAKQNIKVYNFLTLSQPLLLLLTLVFSVFILKVDNINAYLIAIYTSSGITFLISTSYMIKLVNATPLITEKLSWKQVFSNGLINQLGNLAHTLSSRYNYYMIGGSLLVGVYASASSLTESVWIISGSVSPIILTHIANQKDMPNNGRVTFLLSKICFLLSLICIAILVIIPAEFFNWLLGKDFTGIKTIMLYLSPGILVISFSSIISHYFSGLGRQRILLIANGSGLLVTLATSYYFIQQFGLIGACYSASLSYFMQALVLSAAFMKVNKFSFNQLFSFKKDLSLLKN